MNNWSAADWTGFAKQFCDEWEAGWNAHDLPRILRHFADDVVFVSARAEALTGTVQVKGIKALSAYWSAALSAQPDLAFTRTNLFLAPGIVHIRYCTHRGIDTLETLVFDDQRKVILGSAARAPGLDSAAP